jgi:hypothetical protein
MVRVIPAWPSLVDVLADAVLAAARPPTIRLAEAATATPTLPAVEPPRDAR